MTGCSMFGIGSSALHRPPSWQAALQSGRHSCRTSFLQYFTQAGCTPFLPTGHGRTMDGSRHSTHMPSSGVEQSILPDQVRSRGLHTHAVIIFTSLGCPCLQSGVVHTAGGFAALMGSIVLGPRIGRFDEMTDQRQFSQGQNPALYLLGTFLLWFAW